MRFGFNAWRDAQNDSDACMLAAQNVIEQFDLAEVVDDDRADFFIDCHFKLVLKLVVSVKFNAFRRHPAL